jgi:preprotein translocase subunit SecB
MKETATSKTAANPGPEKERYLQFIKGLEIKNLILKSCKAELIADRVDFTKDGAFNVHDECSYKMRDDNTCVVTLEYQLAAAYAGQKEKVLSVEATYEVTYKVSVPMTDEMFGVFSKTSLPLNTWPYFREFANSILTRMGLPGLTLPVLKAG